MKHRTGSSRRPARAEPPSGKRLLAPVARSSSRLPPVHPPARPTLADDDPTWGAPDDELATCEMGVDVEQVLRLQSAAGLGSPIGEDETEPASRSGGAVLRDAAALVHELVGPAVTLRRPPRYLSPGPTPRMEGAPPLPATRSGTRWPLPLPELSFTPVPRGPASDPHLPSVEVEVSVVDGAGGAGGRLTSAWVPRVSPAGRRTSTEDPRAAPTVPIARAMGGVAARFALLTLLVAAAILAVAHVVTGGAVWTP